MVVPRQLFALPGVQVIASNGDSAILYKQLDRPLMERPLFSRSIALTVVLEGIKQVGLQQESIALKPYEAILMGRDLMTVSDLLSEGGYFRQYLLFFDEGTVREFLSGRRLSLLKGETSDWYSMQIDRAFLDFLSTLASTFDSLRRNPASMLRLKLLEALEWLNDRDAGIAHWLFQSVHREPANLRWLMEENFSRGLTVEDFALLSGRSLSTFQREFKRSYGTTPARWIRKKKLERAATFLSAGQLDVTSVAMELGFENISHFIRLFREEFGLSPAEYRKKTT